MTDSVPADGTRECPFCAELIKARAIKCKHCGSLLTDEAMAKFSAELERARSRAAGDAAPGRSETIAPPRPEAPPEDGAARLATVLFADLSGFTSLSGTREPEEMREIMNALFSDLGGCVERFGGQVDKYIGDCVMAAWGLDETQTEDPIRATNAALSMLARMKGRAERLGLPLALHVGVSTGRVVFGTVGAGAGAGKTVLGDTVNLAARLCEKAPSGEVYISEETWRRVSARFAATPIALDLKGMGRVSGFSVVPGRGRPRLSRRVVVDFQGREAEIGRIASVLEAAREGAFDRRAGVLVVGQGGVGKSRLCSYALSHFGSGLRILFAQAVPAETPAFGSLAAAWLHDLFGGGDRTAIDNFFKARPNLARYRVCVQALFASAEESSQNTGFGEEYPLDRELARFFREVSKERPIVLAGADIQWADALSIDLCLALAGSAGDGRVVLVMDGRPDSVTDRLRAAAHIDAIDLGTLSLESMESILRSILAESPARDWVRKVRDRTGGVFIHFNQVLDALAEAGILEAEAGTQRWRLKNPEEELPVPDSLQDLIWLRIERLPTWPREVLLHAGVCGIRFPLRILEIAIGRTSGELERPVADLTADGFLHSSGDTRGTGACMISFEHGSIRETARRMLLKGERKRIADRILGVFETRLTEDVIRPLAPDLFRDAGRETDLRRFLAADAYRLVRSFRLAEARTLLDAVGRDAWPETPEGEKARATHLTALSRLAEAEHDLDGSFEFQRQAVDLLRRRAPRTSELARALGLYGRIATKREDWDAAVAATTEAREISRAIEDEKSLGIQIFMLGWIAEQREDWKTALRYFQESLSLQRSERGLRVSHGSIGRAAIELGEWELAAHHGFEALASAHRDGALDWNPHAYVSILSTTGRVSWRLGDRATALEHLGAGLRVARAIADDEALFMILAPLTRIAAERGGPGSAGTFLAHARETAKRLKFPRWARRVESLGAEIAGARSEVDVVIAPQLQELCDSLAAPPPRRDSLRPVQSGPIESSHRPSVVDE